MGLILGPKLVYKRPKYALFRSNMVINSPNMVKYSPNNDLKVGYLACDGGGSGRDAALPTPRWGSTLMLVVF